VVDSSDVERIGISKEEFHAIVEEEELKDALILVYANKQVGVGLVGVGWCRWGWGWSTPRHFHGLCTPMAHPLPAAVHCAQDLPGALSDAQVAEALGLADIRSRDWAIFKTSAIKGDGLFEGLDWLANTLKARGR
jgi:ADP-ribosylation factor-like protein 1